MALASLGVLDLSNVTNTLLTMLETYFSTGSPFWQDLLSKGTAFPIQFSGAMPDAVRRDAGCQLTFSLFHVTEDKFQRNSTTSARAQTLPFQPLSLDLYYLLTAFSHANYQQEQQAMSVALQFFYQTPIVRTLVTLPGIPGTIKEEFVLSMEIETSDELARLWQAIAVPFRASAVYKVSVVLMTPPATPTPARPVQVAQLTTNPTLFPFAELGETLGVARTVSFASPLSTVAVPEIVNLDYMPGVVAPGQRFFLYGANLNLSTSSRIYLVMPDGTETEVTSVWKVTETNPALPNFQTPNRITLDLPATIGAAPASSPPPGVYQLRAGSDSPPDAATNRTNAAPFSIAAFVDVSAAPPPNPPILAGPGGTYTINGQGFITGHTEILLDTIALTENSPGPPADGQFAVVSMQKIQFRAPAGIATGRYTVRVRVNGVESPPSWWITI
jgi:hypothetical protein